MSDREEWDSAAETYDQAADHGLLDPGCRTAWHTLLLDALPPAPARIVDLGCGTGTMSILFTEQGHRVTGLDFSPAMLALARAKAPDVEFLAGDAAAPALPPSSYDVVFSRHVLWAMPRPEQALHAWLALLAPGGRLVLVEGQWHTGAGLSRAQCERLVRTARAEVDVQPLDDPALWGGPIQDDRYLLVSRS